MPVGRSRRLLVTLLAAIGLGACDSGLVSASKGSVQCLLELASISDEIASAAGYPKDAIDVAGNRKRLQITIIDPKLASAEPAFLEKTATMLVSAAEQALSQRKGCAAVRDISIAIYHPSELGAPLSEWHLENVVEYRRGPGQRFSIYVP